MGLCQPSVNIRSLAAAVLAHALTDLLKGRDAAGVLSWIDGSSAAPAVLDGVSVARYQPAGDACALGGDGCQPCAYREAPAACGAPHEDAVTGNGYLG